MLPQKQTHSSPPSWENLLGLEVSKNAPSSPKVCDVRSLDQLGGKRGSRIPNNRIPCKYRQTWKDAGDAGSHRHQYICLKREQNQRLHICNRI